MVTTEQATRSSNAPGDEEFALRVEDLKVYYGTPRGTVKAVDGVSFDLKQGERFALVGESGSGKSTLAMAIMRLTREPGHIAGGHIYLNGRDVVDMPEKEIRSIRLREMALVPQGAMNSLNPVMRVGDQIIDGIMDHVPSGESPPNKSELEERIHELLIRVGLDPNVARLHPHELSGGMKQRVAMAIAISLDPNIIVADEPTSALDVVVQRQIMQTLGRLQEGLEAAVLLVGHDMGLVAQFADTIGVMYAGKLVEVGSVPDVFKDPKHPYTQLLIESLPSFDISRQFVGIPGMQPALLNLPPGCSFNPRCPSVHERCFREVPAFLPIDGRGVACHLYDGSGVPPLAGEMSDGEPSGVPPIAGAMSDGEPSGVPPIAGEMSDGEPSGVPPLAGEMSEGEPSGVPPIAGEMSDGEPSGVPPLAGEMSEGQRGPTN